MTFATLHLLGAIAVLAIVSFAATLGCIYLALSRGEHRWTIPVISAIFLPAALIVSLSCFGHLSASSIDIGYWRLVVGVGIAISSFILFRHWRDILDLTLSWPACLSGLSGAASLVLFVYLNGTEQFAYNYLGNGEFLNYGRLASAMLNQGAPVTGFVEQHRLLRYGQDIFLAANSDIFKRSPIQLVHIASGYLLFAYGAVVGLIIGRVIESKFLAIVLLIINSAMLLPLFNFNASFFSSTVVLPSTLLVLAYSAIRTPWNSHPNQVDRKAFQLGVLGEAVFLTIFVAFVAITYPEFGYPVIAASLGLACYQSYRMRSFSKSAIAWALALLAIILINYAVFLSGIGGFLAQLRSSNGWNIFGDPRVDPFRFLLNISGLSLGPTPHHVDLFGGVKYILLAGWVFLISFALWHGKSRKDGALSGLILWFTLASYVLLSPFVIGGHWYPAVKFFSQFSIGILLIIGFAFSGWTDSAKSSVKWISGFILVAICCAYVVVAVQEVRLAKKDVEILDVSAWTKALDNESKLLPFFIFKENDGEIIWFAELVAIDSGLKLVPISRGQAERLARGPIAYDHTACRAADNVLSTYDFSSFPRLSERLLALVGAEDQYGVLTSDSGFTIPVLKQETIARLGKFRLDRVTVNPGSTISFPQSSWAVDGKWSACIPSDRHAVDVTIAVPDSLLRSGPIDIRLQFAGDTSLLHVMKPGRYTMSGRATSSRDSPRVITIETAATWTPRDFDPHSLDTRRLGISVASISMN